MVVSDGTCLSVRVCRVPRRHVVVCNALDKRRVLVSGCFVVRAVAFGSMVNATDSEDTMFRVLCSRTSLSCNMDMDTGAELGACGITWPYVAAYGFEKCRLMLGNVGG